MGLGSGMGRGGSRQGLGRRGQNPTICKCSSCGYTTPHTRGTPCTSIKCPKCGKTMIGAR